MALRATWRFALCAKWRFLGGKAPSGAFWVALSVPPHEALESTELESATLARKRHPS